MEQGDKQRVEEANDRRKAAEKDEKVEYVFNCYYSMFQI